MDGNPKKFKAPTPEKVAISPTSSQEDMLAQQLALAELEHADLVRRAESALDVVEPDFQAIMEEVTEGDRDSGKVTGFEQADDCLYEELSVHTLIKGSWKRGRDQTWEKDEPMMSGGPDWIEEWIEPVPTRELALQRIRCTQEELDLASESGNAPGAIAARAKVGAAILEAVESGVSPTDLARALGRTPQWVARALKRSRI